MEFLNLNFLWNLIWVLPLFLILALLASQRRKKLLTSVLGKKYSDSEYINLSHSKRSLKTWLLIGIAVFLIITASRPYWGYKLLPFSGSGKDILAVLDVSKSMLSKDIQPSRLEHAKLLLKNLIKDTPGDRYGIIAFAGSAFLECPLTIDRTSLFSILKDININSIPVGGTNIEKALKTAIKAFKAAAGGYKAIILITDGDELHGKSENVIEKLKELKTPLLVVGIGDPSKPGLIQLPAKDGQSRFLKNSKGELVKSKLNETQLKKLAEATNGVYIRSTAVDPGLNILEKKISQLIPEKYEDGKMTRPLEKYQLPLLVVVILIFIWLCIGEVKRKKNHASKAGKTVGIFLFSALLMLLSNNSILHADNTSPKSSNTGIEQQQPLQISKESSQTTVNSSTESNDNIEEQKTPLEIFNMGVAAHEKGNIDVAKKNYTNAINIAENNKNIRSKAYQNMGVLQHAAARKLMMQNPEESLKILDKAEHLYKEAMRRDTLRQDIASNQQILINDRKKTKEIIKRRKEMEKKKNEARQKTQEALEKQKQANKEKQNKNQQQKEKQKQDQKQKQDDKQQQEQKQNQEQKQDASQEQQQDQKSNNNHQQQNKSKQEQREANRKTQEAQKAMQDYKEAAKQNNSQKDMQAAQSASNDITKARKNQINDKTQDAEKDLQEALKKLGGQPQQQNNKDNQQNKSQQQNKQDKNQQQKNKNQDTQQKKNQAESKTQEALNQQQQANQAQGQDKQKKQQKANQKTQEAQKAMNDYKKSAEQNNNPEEQKKAERAKQNLQNAQQSQKNNDGAKAEQQLKEALKNIKGKNSNKQKNMPQQPKAKPMQPKHDNKDIDPKQAEALLKLMANEEKSLKDELKKRQKKAYGNMYIDKDW